MIVNDFSKVIMSALFGDLAGYDNHKGITHLAYGEGQESWDSGTIAPVIITDSGLVSKKGRVPFTEIFLLNNVVIAQSNILAANPSGVRVAISEPYPDFHFNDLTLSVTSGSNTYSTVVDQYYRASGLITFKNNVTSLNSASAVEIRDVVMLANQPGLKIVFNTSIKNLEIPYTNVREEGLVGAGATSIENTGYFANLTRFVNRPTGGPLFNVQSQHTIVISSGIFIK